MTGTGAQQENAFLTERELEILRLLAEGLTNREIGERLFLSPETIKWYNKQIYDKLGVAKRGQAVNRARDLGLLVGGLPRVHLKGAPQLKIPTPLTSFIGREHETAELLKLLQEARLVTITGPGGSGKTRLSLHVAEKVALRFSSGVIFVSLATTRNPERVANAVAQELGVVEQSGRQMVESLQQYLANKEYLLILDNFEHLLPAAPLVTDLLADAPRLTVLATSREPLHLGGEREFPLYPLELPDELELGGAGLENYPAIALFCQRAQAASPTFVLTDDNALTVAAICQRLDGLPLAIELAAAWIKLFTPQQLLERLGSRLDLLRGGPRDAPDRQRTLRNTLDWSYQLLTYEEQTFFNRLAVFVGGRTIEAMEAVCCPGLSAEPIDVLSALFDKSLIYQEQDSDLQPRFIMLETIHEYAWEQLIASSEEQELRNRHLAYFLELAEKIGPGYRWHDQLRLLKQTVVEMNNMRAAFTWALQSDQFEAAARLASSLDYFLYYKGGPVEGFQWFQRLQPHTESIPKVHLARMLIGTGRLAWATNHLEIAESAYKRSLALARQINNPEYEALSLLGLSIARIGTEPYEQGLARCDEAIDISRRINDLPGIAQAQNFQGELARFHGDTSTARQKYEASLATSRETGEIYRVTMIVSNLSMTAYNEGDYRQALDYSLEAMQSWIEIDVPQGIGSELEMIAGPYARLGQPGKAARLMAAGHAYLKEIGAADHPSDIRQINRYKAYIRETLGDRAFTEAWAEGSAMTTSTAVAYARER